MTFLERIQNRVQEGEGLPTLKKWIAEGQSLYSATSESRNWLPKVTTATEALQALFLGLFLPEWETWELVRKIGEEAYRQRYQGSWFQVQEVLEQEFKISKIEDQYQFFSYNPDEFFGNFLFECEKFLKRNQKSFKSDRSALRRPRRRIRRRGYKDKGQLRPFDKRGRLLPDPEPGEDLRRKIKYGHNPYWDSEDL